MGQQILVCIFAALLIQSTGAQTAQNPALAGDEGGQSSAQTNHFTSDADIREGERLFQIHCSYCHGPHGEGGRGADLTAGIYRQGGSDSELYNTIRSGVAGSEMPAVQTTTDETWKIAAFVKRIGSQGMLEKANGDPAPGKMVYARSGCAACHRIGQEGRDLGPDLTNVGRRRGLRFLEESILKPEAFIPNNYRAVRIELKSAATIVGIRLNEDDLSVQLRDTDGNLRSIMKDDIQEIRFNQPSLMPSYQSALSGKDVADLVAYLNSLKGAR